MERMTKCGVRSNDHARRCFKTCSARLRISSSSARASARSSSPSTNFDASASDATEEEGSCSFSGGARALPFLGFFFFFLFSSVFLQRWEKKKKKKKGVRRVDFSHGHSDPGGAFPLHHGNSEHVYFVISCGSLKRFHFHHNC